METDVQPIWRKQLLAKVASQLMRTETKVQQLEAILWNLKPVLEDMAIQANLESAGGTEHEAWIRQLRHSRKALDTILTYLSSEYYHLKANKLTTEVDGQEGSQDGPHVEGGQEPEVPSTIRPQLYTDGT